MEQKVYDKAWKLLKGMGWCRDESAVDQNGHDVPPDSRFACKFCAIGSLERVYGEDIYDDEKIVSRVRHQLLGAILATTKFHTIPDWNDDKQTTKAKVIGLLKRLDI